jgi:hypothetical protein
MSTLLLLAALLATAAAGAPALPVRDASHPLTGFDGRWVLDTARSEFGSAHSVLRAREDELTSDGERLRVRSRSVRADGDSTRLDYVYRADSTAENMLSGQVVRTTGRHVGRTLEFVSVVKLLLLELRVDEHWSLAAGGDTLVMQRTSHSPMGNQHQVLYFAKRGGAGAPARKP